MTHNRILDNSLYHNCESTTNGSSFSLYRWYFNNKASLYTSYPKLFKGTGAYLYNG